MNETSSTTKGVLQTDGPPDNNPMNLGCTGTNLNPQGEDTPSAVQIYVYDSAATPPTCPTGYDTFIGADSGVEYTLTVNGNSKSSTALK